MKRWLVVAVLLAVAGAAVYYSERQKSENHVGPEAVLNAAAEAQREVSRPFAEITKLSDEEEAQVGDAIVSQYGYRALWVSSTDEPIDKYVSAIGMQVAARAHRKLAYRFHYIPDPNFINAFALPGGHVFIGKGLILLLESEDELAAVLGHEVEHVDHYHCNERVALQSRLKHIPLAQLLVLPVELFQAGYSKTEELEADRDGTALAVMAGYSPQGAIHLFQVFERLHREYVLKAESPVDELSQVAIQTLAGYFRSHPLPKEREDQIKSLVATENWPQRKERPLKVRVVAAAANEKLNQAFTMVYRRIKTPQDLVIE